MSGAEAIAAIQLIDACIGIANTILDIGRAVQDAQGLPPKLRNLVEKLPAIGQLLESAHDSFEEGKVTADTSKTIEPVLRQCENALSELREVFRKACPQDGENRGKRLWRGAKTVFFGRESRVQKLLQEIQDDLKLLEQEKIYTIGDQLDELQALTEGLGHDDTGKYSHTGDGHILVFEGGNPTTYVGGSGQSRQINNPQNYHETNYYKTTIEQNTYIIHVRRSREIGAKEAISLDQSITGLQMNCEDLQGRLRVVLSNLGLDRSESVTSNESGIRDLFAELQVLRHQVSALRAFTDPRNIAEERGSLISARDVVVSFSKGTLLLDELRTSLSLILDTETARRGEVSSIMRQVDYSQMPDLLSQLKWQNKAFSLQLEVFESKSAAKAKRASVSLRTHIDEEIARSQSLQMRLSWLEDEVQRIASEAASKEARDGTDVFQSQSDENIQPGVENFQHASRGPENRPLGSDGRSPITAQSQNNDLEVSQGNTPRTGTLVHPDLATSQKRFSTLAEIDMSSTSILSVLALPLTMSELSHKSWYAKEDKAEQDCNEIAKIQLTAELVRLYEGMDSKDSPGKPISIDLDGLHLERLPVSTIELLKDRVERLALSRNRLHEIPIDIVYCSHLWYLNIRRNRFKSFPTALFSLQSLEILDLAHNEITEIPQDIRMMKRLAVLNIHHNQVGTLPQALGYAWALQKLVIFENPLHLPSALRSEFEVLLNAQETKRDSAVQRRFCSSAKAYLRSLPSGTTWEAEPPPEEARRQSIMDWPLRPSNDTRQEQVVEGARSVVADNFSDLAHLSGYF